MSERFLQKSLWGARATSLWCPPVQTARELVKTRPRSCFPLRQKKNTVRFFLMPLHLSVCNHCSFGLNNVRFPVSNFHQLPAGWLGSTLPEWSSSVLSQSESSYRPWLEEKTGTPLRSETLDLQLNHLFKSNHQAFIMEFLIWMKCNSVVYPKGGAVIPVSRTHLVVMVTGRELGFHPLKNGLLFRKAI